RPATARGDVRSRRDGARRRMERLSRAACAACDPLPRTSCRGGFRRAGAARMTGGREGIDTSGEARLAEPVVSRSATVSLLGELWSFMRVRKKWWLGPIVLVYLVIAPVGFVLRHLVRDPLDRSLADGKASNWVKRERQRVEIRRYEQQF